MQRSFLASAIGASLLLASTTTAAADGVHTVAPGETLSGIAAANGISSATLAAANGISPQAFVIAGRPLQIPAAGPGSTSTSSSGGGHLVVPGETLSGIAAANGLSAATLASANGLSPTSFVIAGTRLSIPGAAGATVTVSAPGSSTDSGSASGGHMVVPGETLSGIAAANGLSAATLASANGLSPTSFVIAGTHLRIPAAGSATSVAGAGGDSGSSTTGGGHLVQPGETLSGIAAANGISLSSLASANGLSTTSFAIAGTRVRVPARTTSTVATAPPAMGGYVVRSGDTLSGLAARSGVTAAQIAYMNGLDSGAQLIAGRALKLPTGSPVLAGSSPASSATPVAPTAAPQPTPGRMTSSQIQAIAAQYGVPGSLAAAIAWQESGFNNAMVSSASARGVMQVMPGTWDWVQSYLTGGRRLDPFSAEDNVRAGALYLAHLLRQTGGDPALAAAGYYQGLASVQRIGMLPETRRYVADVIALRSRFGG